MILPATAFAARRGSAAAGFTLVEVMVALTILSLVMVVTVTGFRTLGNTQVSIDRMTDRVDEIRSVSSFLRDAFEATVVGDDNEGLTLGGGGGSSSDGFFRIAEQGVEWRSALLFGEAFGGSFYLRLVKQDDALVLQWQEPRGRRPSPWTDSQSRVVIDQVEAFTVAYKREPDGPWQEQWDRSISTPSLIRLSIKSSGRYWPDLIMDMGR